MKYIFLTLLITFAFLFTVPSYAQEKEQTSFAKATDEQIEEAETFYESCTQNDSMSSLRDCKCAASEFLDTRIELGDDATIGDVMAANIDKCLKNSDNAQDVYGADNAEMPEVTGAQLEEAEMVFENCKSTLKLRRYYDCECYAAKFLDGRIKKGPLASKEEIIETFYSDCRNIVETTGYEYTRCMARATKRPVKGIEPKDYCECYARQWAKQFEAYQGLINFSSKGLMKERAMSYCRRTENYN